MKDQSEFERIDEADRKLIERVNEKYETKQERYARRAIERAERLEAREIKKAKIKAKRSMEFYMDGWLPLLSVGVAISVGIAAYGLLPGDGWGHLFQTTVMALTGGLISYGGNKICFHKASWACARGHVGANIGCNAWFALMTVVVGTATFSGLARESVEADKLRGPYESIQAASRDANRSSISAATVQLEINAVASELVGLASCEESRGCITSRPGPGTMTARLRRLSSRVEKLGRAYGSADKKRLVLAKVLAAIAVEYESQLNTGGATGKSRAILSGIVSKGQRTATELESVMPTGSTRSLINELQTMPAPPAKPRKIDLRAKLDSLAGRLKTAVATVGTSKVSIDGLPRPSGVSVGFEGFSKNWLWGLLAFSYEIFIWFAFLMVVLDLREQWRKMRRQASPGGDPNTDPDNAVAETIQDDIETRADVDDIDDYRRAVRAEERALARRSSQ